MDGPNKKNIPQSSTAFQPGIGAPFYDATCPWLNSANNWQNGLGEPEAPHEPHSPNQQHVHPAVIPFPGYGWRPETAPSTATT